MTFHDRSRLGAEHPMVSPKYNFFSLDSYRQLSISSSIIKEAKALHKTGFGLPAYYCFHYIDTTKQDIRGLLSSLVAQLSAKSDLCYKILSDLYSKHDFGSLLPDDGALTQCLKEMFKPPIYIIVDALDKCPNLPGPPSPHELVLDLIEELDDGEASEYDSDWRPDDARQAVLSACSSLITILNVDGFPVV